MNDLRSVTLYYQTDVETGGNAGWAANEIYRDGTHESFAIEDDDIAMDGADVDQGAPLYAVRNAYLKVCGLDAGTPIEWSAVPSGGWRGVVHP